ncbi:MAG: pseudouridine synthase [Syntrophobacteraceae bacterium]|nr:pseudouridine synthase [Syntrophobacteraceae bacterium]
MKRIEGVYSRSGVGRAAGFGGGPSRFSWITGQKDKGCELAEVVSGYLKISKEKAADLIDFGSVYVRGSVERDPSMRLSGGEEILVSFPSHGTARSYEIDPARVIFRDRFLLAYDKEAGIPSQQLPFDAYNNVFAALLRHLSAGKEGERYAALHHRLDMETSGLLVFALDRKANEPLGRAFQERKVKKEYLAWVEGFPPNDSWTSEAEIGKVGGKYKAVRTGEGKQARTVFRVLGRKEGRSLVLASPLTGRTHQIRIHLGLAGHPVAGDRAYGAKPDSRLYLHAWRLTLKHPVSGKELKIEAPVPAGWPEVVDTHSS